MTILSNSHDCVLFTKTCCLRRFFKAIDFLHNFFCRPQRVLIHPPQSKRLNRFTAARTVFRFPFCNENFVTVRVCWCWSRLFERFRIAGLVDSASGGFFMVKVWKFVAKICSPDTRLAGFAIGNNDFRIHWTLTARHATGIDFVNRNVATKLYLRKVNLYQHKQSVTSYRFTSKVMFECSNE